MRDDLLLLRAGADDKRALIARVDALFAASDLAFPAPSDGAVRLAIVAPANELRARLALARERIASIDRPRLAMRNQGIYFATPDPANKVALLFPGQGSQHAGMLRDLIERVEPVRAWLEALDRAAARAGEPPPSRLLDDDARREELYDMQRGAQLGTVADLALFDLLAGFGLRGDFAIGHSNGEHAAIIAAGMVSGLDRDALCDAFVRVGVLGRALRAPSSPERMAAVSAIAGDALASLIAAYDDCYLAMDNCPHQLVVAGRADSMQRLGRDVVAAGGIWGELPFARAYHTPLFADWASTLASWYAELPFGEPRMPVYSCLTAAPLAGDVRADITAQWTAPVRFRDTIEAVYAAGARTFVEVGPDSKLTAFVDDILRGRAHVAVSASSPHASGPAQLQHLAAELYTQGITLDMGNQSLTRLLRGEAAGEGLLAAATATHQRLITQANASLTRVRESLATHREQHHFTRANAPWLDDHALGRKFPILPFTMSMALAAQAAERLTGTRTMTLTNVRASRWIAFEDEAIDVRVVARRRGDAVAVSVNEGAFECTLGVRQQSCRFQSGGSAAALLDWSVDRFYRDYAFHGPSYQTLATIHGLDDTHIDAELITRTSSSLPLDPALVDAAGQLVAFWLLEHIGREPSFGIFPFAARQVALHAAPPAEGTRVRCRGTIELSQHGTNATFEFATEDGAPLVTLEGFEQRLIDFPPAVADWIFRGEAAPLEAEDLAFLDEHRVFARALASMRKEPVHGTMAMVPQP